jgi:hypothetical protein
MGKKIRRVGVNIYLETAGSPQIFCKFEDEQEGSPATYTLRSNNAVSDCNYCGV